MEFKNPDFYASYKLRPYLYERFHAFPLKRTRMGSTSRRPTIIQRERISLDRPEKTEKLLIGPTSSSPGPTLLIQVNTAVKVVPKVKLSSATRSAAPKRIKR